MSKYLIIMQGCSASGKSTIAKAIADSMGGVICSADNYFMQDGKYCFDASQLGKAHECCRHSVKTGMFNNEPLIIVDNTNCTQKEANPYIEMAKEHGYTVQVVTVQTSMETMVAQNDTRSEDRKIPLEVMQRQMERITKIKL